MELGPLLRRHPAVRSVSLVGSRARGEETELSDWDFAVEAEDFDAEAIDAHFWDWILWLAAKRRRGRDEIVASELEKMHGYLLGPMGVEATPTTIEDALAAYLEARDELERRFAVPVPRALEREVAPALADTSPADASGV